jgi:excinuclease ABC subunit A
MNITPAKAIQEDSIEILGAREHNLKNLDLTIPRNQLVVITGLSGSGKSSLAFDTIYAEGQRRYIETFSAYARQFLGGMERPDVDKINGLSPVIAIEQKTTSRNPRSTVGTVTEIYDFLRVLYARVAEAYSYNTGEKMVSYTPRQMADLIMERFEGKRIQILAPLVKSRKGHYRELFEQIARQGYLRVRINGEVQEILRGMKLDRYKTHDIEVVIDRLPATLEHEKRMMQSLQTALHQGKGTLMVMEENSQQPVYFSKNLMCPTTGISYPEPEPNTFSFNSPKGCCPQCNGLGKVKKVDLDKVIPNPRKSIRQGGLAPLGEAKNIWVFNQLEAIGKKYDFTLDSPIEDIPEEGMHVILNGAQESFQVQSKDLGITRKYNLNWEGLIEYLESQTQGDTTNALRSWAEAFTDEVVCDSCQGNRLRKESLYFRLGQHSIADLSNADIRTLAQFLNDLEDQLEGTRKVIATELLKELRTRVGFLLEVGLDYLSLNRSAQGLSGGEAQRIRLATQIGSQLTGVLYILDEPSIGLHQRDNQKLIDSLRKLKELGNSLLVVEHDQDMMEAADHIIDMGPGAGKHGGKIVAQGQYHDILAGNSLTADYLSGRKSMPVPRKRRKANGHNLILIGATGNNLKSVDLQLPLGQLVVVTGVSGSGKSSLINETLYPILNKHFFRARKEPLPFMRIEGLKHLDKVIDIDQSPIGRTPRSNPATYTGVWSDIRTLFAELPEAKVRGYKPGRFSFNVKGGRCETCQGGGMKVIEMNFLPDVLVHCETCQGKRFNRETLEVRYKGKSIADVLDMTIEEAASFFEHIPSIYRRIRTLHDVGLDYITLGQSSTTLSGGEAQRVKLATELSKRDTGKTIYILDEPTTGLHFEDIRVLMDVIQQLVDRGNSVVIIEHNLDVIKMADHVIDIGPEGGAGGGTIVAQGTPEDIARHPQSHTGVFLQKILSHES